MFCVLVSFFHENAGWTYSIKYTGKEVGKRGISWERARTRMRPGQEERGGEGTGRGGGAASPPGPWMALVFPRDCYQERTRKNDVKAEFSHTCWNPSHLSSVCSFWGPLMINQPDEGRCVGQGARKLLSCVLTPHNWQQVLLSSGTSPRRKEDTRLWD